MNYFLSLFLITLAFSFSILEKKNQQQEVLQRIFEIEEFQRYLSYSPRFVATTTKQEVLMMNFPELENKNILLSVGDKTIRIIDENDLKDLEHNFFIKIDEFKLKKSKAKVLISYLNSRMYYEKKQKILLDAQLAKTEENGWVIENYKLFEVSISTSD